MGLQFKTAQVRLADNASGQGVRGTSGRVSKLFQEWCSPLSAMPRSGDAPACGRYLEPASLRMTGSFEELTGVAHRSGQGFHPARALLALWHGTRVPSLGSAHRTWSGFRGRFGPSSPQNNASGSHPCAALTKSMFRTGGNASRSVRRPSPVASEILPCTRKNTTWPLRGRVGTRSRRIRNVSRVWS